MLSKLTSVTAPTATLAAILSIFTNRIMLLSRRGPVLRFLRAGISLLPLQPSEIPPVIRMIPTSTSSLQVNKMVLSLAVKFVLQPFVAPEPLLFHIVSRPLHLNSFLFTSFPETVRGRGASPLNRHSKRSRKNTRGTATRHGALFPLKPTLARKNRESLSRMLTSIAAHPCIPLVAPRDPSLLICEDRQHSPIMWGLGERQNGF